VTTCFVRTVMFLGRFLYIVDEALVVRYFPSVDETEAAQPMTLPELWSGFIGY